MKLVPVSHESYSVIINYYNTFRIEASELSFTNLFMWRHKYNFHYIIVGDYLWICNIKNESTYYFSQPLGDYSQSDALRLSILELKAMLTEKGMSLIIKKADMSFMSVLQELDFNTDIQEDRNSFDYVYDFGELSALAGNKYHKKKNHINKFMKTVPDFTYYALTEETLPLLKESYHFWFDENPREGLEEDSNSEKHAIEEALNHFELLNFKGGMIQIGGKIEAYTLGEALNPDTLLIHIEKANNAFAGLYTVINQLFLTNQTTDFLWINREQDLGIEGLRKAKLSYHPAFFIEKFIVRFS